MYNERSANKRSSVIVRIVGNQKEIDLLGNEDYIIINNLEVVN